MRLYVPKLRVLPGRPQQAGRRRAILLDDVSQFVGKQMATGVRVRREFRCAEDDVPTYRVGLGVQVTGRSLGSGVGMDANSAEVLAKPGFEIVSSGRVERPAWRTQDVVQGGPHASCRGPAPVALAAQCRRRGAHNLRIRHAHDAVGGGIGLPLGGIARRAHPEGGKAAPGRFNLGPVLLRHVARGRCKS